MKTRDESGKFVATNKEMTDEQREAICYKSKLLNKYFDNYDELVEAEAEFKKAHEAELKAKEDAARAREAEKQKKKSAWIFLKKTFHSLQSISQQSILKFLLSTIMTM